MIVIIRYIATEDYPLLEDFLYNAIFVPPGVKPPPREVIYEPEIFVYIKDFGGKDDCGVIAEQEGSAVGAAWARIIPAYGRIDDSTPELAISVLSEYRGQGIGTMLMERLFDVLRERGHCRTSLSVQKDNPAVRFYKRLGYEITDEKLDHAGHEDYIMVKELFRIKPLSESDIQSAMGLVWRVFLEFEAPDYSDEGVAEFKRFIDEAPQNEELRLWGSFIDDVIVGIIAVRPPCHITLLFVDKNYHRRGIARSLFTVVLSDKDVINGHEAVTVNSSPYAAPAYRRLGFIATGMEQVTNGIRFTPMAYSLNDRHMFRDIKPRITEPEVGVIISYAALDGTPEGVAEEAEKYLSSGKLNFYGWVEDGRVAGVCGFEVHSDKVEIHLISVAGDKQRQGIGGAMVATLQKMYGLPLEAETVEEAVGFYRKCGFSTTAFQHPEWGKKYTCLLGPKRRGASRH